MSLLIPVYNIEHKKHNDVQANCIWDTFLKYLLNKIIINLTQHKNIK